MRYKIIETEKDQRQKELNGNTMLYKKTKIEHDATINEYEMVVTYFENDIAVSYTHLTLPTKA